MSERAKTRSARWLMLLACGALCWLATCARESPEDCIRQFRSMDAKVRIKAGNKLIRFEADEVLPLLIQESESEYIKVRFEVMRMLGRFKDRRGLLALIKGLDDKSPRVAAMAAASLSMLRASEALAALLMYTHDPTEKVRQYVIGALGPCHSYEREPELSDSAYSEVLRALRSSMPPVRIAALQSMREFGYRGATEQILRMAGDPSVEVRHVAVQALGEIGAARGGGEAAAASLNDRGESGEVADPIEEVSAEMRVRIVDVLIESLEGDELQSIRTKAVRALGQIGDRRGIVHLDRLRGQGSEEDVREAQRALDRLRSLVAE